ncbi:MAG: hypothetical protein AB1641_02535 [Thermodesulfobacteriota bacterium]
MAETPPEVRGTIYSLLVFVDIVDSSKYSTVLGYKEYARRLLDFQNTFEKLGKTYFPDPVDRSREYCLVRARGDEGILFYATTQPNFSELVFRSIEFIYHLKGRLRFGIDEKNEGSTSPRRMGLGAGIHVGQVAFAIKQENSRSIIDRLEGFSINYAKRVESCSRLGKYSRVFLSKEAAKVLEDKPVVLSRMTAPMKGIEESTEVFEVQAGLFSGVKLDPSDPEDEYLQSRVNSIVDRLIEMEEPWIKSLAVSVLDYLLGQSPVSARRQEYRNLQLNLAWHSSIEDDPILLYVRARDFWEKKKYTQYIRYLRQILQDHPEFVHARKRMITACWAITKGRAEPADKIFARDMAREFLDHFPQFLTAAEKKEFQALIKKAESKVKREKGK